MKSLSDIIWDGADAIDELENTTDGLAEMMVHCVAMCSGGSGGSGGGNNYTPFGTGSMHTYCIPKCD